MRLKMQFLVVFITILVEMKAIETKHGSFSFFKFSGPVSGEVEEIYVSDGSGPHSQQKKIDYTARPDYSFHYGVQDTHHGNSQGHKESRQGDTVTGEYRVLQDDGLIRIVRYTADPATGFQAQIEYVRLNRERD